MKTTYHNSCYLCGSTQIKELKGYEEHELAKCSNCSFVFMRRIPTNDELINYYSVYAYETEKQMSEPTRQSLEGLVKKFDPYRKNNRILDVGCGEGWILEISKKHGWEVYGTEYSSRAIEICEAKGIKMYQGVLDPGKMNVSEFDVIISSETVEHINNPQEDFNNINKLLRKEGLLYVTTPNFNSYLRYLLKKKYNIIEYPEHLSYYTKKTLHALLANNGFKKVKLLTTGVSLTRFQNSISSDNGKLAGKVSTDEKIRTKIMRSGSLQFIKKMVNKGLTMFGLGMTLKAYYVKK
jgi:2-polyprenyl-3-methyl-5-hydroxy-6-metoxy-1,4-benzoquinol methylase